jgi:hypothetical protein
MMVEGLGFVSVALITGSLGRREKVAEAIRNRPIRRRLRTGSPEVDASIDLYKQAVAATKALPAADPRSWTAQAQIHGTVAGGFVPPAVRLPPSLSTRGPSDGLKIIRECTNIRFDIKQRVHIADRVFVMVAKPLSLATQLGPEGFSQIIDSYSAREWVFASIQYAQFWRRAQSRHWKDRSAAVATELMEQFCWNRSNRYLQCNT